MDPIAAKRREERFKLLATFFSNVGVALIVTGVLAPLFAGAARPGLIVGSLVLAGLSHALGQLVLYGVVRNPPLQEVV